MIRIQEDLITLAAERRLIPFLGAGFSAALGLPSWESMLREVCDAAEGALPFDDVMKATNGDLLQVAEYLYLRHDRQIGPIRHQIERSFSAKHADPLTSGSHVELANLGASQIYTTNYDDILEQTYRKLGLPVTPVILPKDVALADQERTQVVKYHGDLSHERTLVLTESAYYKRLDFESPMDLKFRSDLLGKSVLFMGYSFRDINIRIIWFKLMDMMRDIPESDRRPSYIVRFEPNAALEELYAAVGLKTIILNPSGPVADDTTRGKLLGEFLLSLSIRANRVAEMTGGKGRPAETFVSRALIDEATPRREGDEEFLTTRSFRRYGSAVSEDPVLSRLFTGTVPEPLRKAWNELVVKLLPSVRIEDVVIDVMLRLDDKKAMARAVIASLRENGNTKGRDSRKKLIASDLPWSSIWSMPLERDEIVNILTTFEEEIRYQATRGADDDIATLADLANRIAEGQLVEKPLEEKHELPPEFYTEAARQLVALAGTIYPSIAQLIVTDGPPDVEAVRQEVKKRASAFKPVEVSPEELFTFRLLQKGHGLRSAAKPRTLLE